MYNTKQLHKVCHKHDNNGPMYDIGYMSFLIYFNAKELQLYTIMCEFLIKNVEYFIT